MIGKSHLQYDGGLSPVRGFLVVVTSVFLTEFLIMIVYSRLGVKDTLAADFLDASILALVISIVSYYAVARPLISSREALRMSEQRLRAVFDSSAIGIAIADKTGNLHETNDAFQEMLGYSDAELATMPIDKLVHHNGADSGTGVLSTLIAGGCDVGHVEKRYLHKSGLPVWCREHVSIIRNQDEVLFFCIMVEDVSLLRDAEYEKRLATTLFQTSAEAMVITDSENRILRVNPAFTKITGYTQGEVLGKNPKLLSSGYHNAAFYDALWIALRQEGHWSGDLWNRHKSGYIYAQRVTISLVRDQHGVITNYTAVFSDVTNEKRKNEEIRHQAHYDALTNLPNRSLLWERLLMVFPRGTDKPDLAILFIDLDGFKQVNDQYGHQVGDKLLQFAAERLKRSVRHSDTVARLGGDEFVIIIHESHSQIVARKIAENILRSFRQTIRIDDYEITIGASIGVAVFPADGENPDTLLSSADTAMYRAKQAGKNTVCFYGNQTPGSP